MADWRPTKKPQITQITQIVNSRFLEQNEGKKDRMVE